MESKKKDKDPIRIKTPVIYSILAACAKPLVGYPNSNFFEWVISHPKEAENKLQKWEEMKTALELDLVQLNKGIDQKVRFVGVEDLREDRIDQLRKKLFELPEGNEMILEGKTLIVDFAGQYPTPKRLEVYRNSVARASYSQNVEVIENPYRLKASDNQANLFMLELLDLVKDSMEILLKMARERDVRTYANEFYNSLLDIDNECREMLDGVDGVEYSISCKLVLLGLICVVQCTEKRLFMERKICIVKMVKKYFLKDTQILEAVQKVLDPKKPGDFDEAIYSEYVAFHRLIFNIFGYECTFPGGDYTHEVKFFNQVFKLNHYHIFRVFTGEYEETHKDTITDLKLFYIAYLDKQCLVTSSMDKTVTLWDQQGGRIRSFLHNSGVTCLDVCIDGNFLVSGCADATLYITPLVNKKPRIKILRGHTGTIRGVLITPSKKYIYSISSDCTVVQWDFVTGEAIVMGQHRHIPVHLLSIDGTDDLITTANDHTIKIWEGATRAITTLKNAHTDYVCYAKLSPNGKHLVSCSWDTTSKIWDITNERLLNTLDGHIVEDDSMPRGYREMNGHSKHVTWCDIHESGEYLVTASNDATVKLWEIDEGLFLKSFEGHTSSVVHCVFINKGWWIASCSNDSTVRIWDWQDGKCVTVLRGHFGAVLSCVETSWGLVSCGKDRSLRVWQLAQFLHYRNHFPKAGDTVEHGHMHERAKSKTIKERRMSVATKQANKKKTEREKPKGVGFAEEIEQTKVIE